MRDPVERLRDMVEAIERIERYASRGRQAFDADELLQTWIIHHLEILGEAAARIPDDVRERGGDIAWPEIVGMRNILVHGYFGIDTTLVWTAVERDIPVLRKKLERLLASIT